MSGKKLFFNDPKLQSDYVRNGYVVTNFLEQAKVKALENEFYKIFGGKLSQLPSVYDTIATEDVETINKVNEAINRVCAESIHALISNARIVASIFILKKPGNDSFKGLHVDATMTTEEYNNVGVWIPLCAVDENVGRMCLVRGTQHTVKYNTPSMPCPYHDIETELLKEMICFDMLPGQALFFDNRMLHCTEMNKSSTNRIAVVSKLIDVDAPLVTTYYLPENQQGEKVMLYEHIENIFESDAFRLPTPPSSSKFIGYVNDLPKQVTLEEYNAAKQQLRTSI